MTAPKLLALSLLPALGLLAAGTAMAADPASMPNDRWEISAGYFRPDVSLSGGFDGTVTDGTTIEAGQGQGTLRDRFDGGQVEAIWRFSPRQRLVGGWYGVGQDRTYSLTEAGTFVPPDGGVPVDYAVDGEARWDTDFELYRLSYGFDLIQTRNAAVTALVGVYGAKIDTSLTSSGTALVEGEAYDLAGRTRLNETEYAPGLGLSAEWRPAERWDLRAGIQGFRTQWGGFDTRGHFHNAQIQAGYRFAPNWTGFVGYDWFDLKLEDDKAYQTVQDGVTYTAEGEVTGRLKIHGPVVGIRAHF